MAQSLSEAQELRDFVLHNLDDKAREEYARRLQKTVARETTQLEKEKEAHAQASGS